MTHADGSTSDARAAMEAELRVNAASAEVQDAAGPDERAEPTELRHAFNLLWSADGTTLTVA